jgi:predicted RNA-binding Zn-ribbon protein involved in translation (DUF1610 family)
MDVKNTQEIQYCKSCGNVIEKDADFCPACGEQTRKSEISYVKANKGGFGAGQVIALLLGGFLILISIPILFGGGAVMGVSGIFDQGGGFIGVNNIDFETGTRVLIAKSMDIEGLDYDDFDGPPRWLWEPTIGDLVKIKIEAESNDGKPVFIGIIRESDALEYFGDVEYDYITDFHMENPRSRPYISYRKHSGVDVTFEPADLDIWVEEVHGNGEQTMVWEPEVGDYWLVIMNEDASAGVDMETGLSVRVPILGSIGRGLFLGGLVSLAFGVAVVYFGAIKPRY